MSEKEINIEEVKKELNELEEDDYLKTYIKHIEKKLESLENEKQVFKETICSQEQNIKSLKKEIERLREPPLVGAVIIDILDKDQGRVIVQSGTGLFFVVNAFQNINKEELKPGAIVSLNQRNFAIIEILPITSKQIKNAREKLYLTEYTWENVKPDNKND